MKKDNREQWLKRITRGIHIAEIGAVLFLVIFLGAKQFSSKTAQAHREWGAFSVLKAVGDRETVTENEIASGLPTETFGDEQSMTSEQENVVEPTDNPVVEPVRTPTPEPEKTPTTEPVRTPTTEPEKMPTTEPERTPTTEPERTPTTESEKTPTTKPEKTPTAKPVRTPTTKPAKIPTSTPTIIPSKVPTKKPTATPVVWIEPEITPSLVRRTDIEKRIMDKVNAYRKSLGIPAWENPYLFGASAVDNSIGDWMMSTCDSVARKNAQTFSANHGPNQMGAAAQMMGSETADEVAEKLFQLWKNSPMHHAQMVEDWRDISGDGAVMDYETVNIALVIVYQYSDGSYYDNFAAVWMDTTAKESERK